MKLTTEQRHSIAKAITDSDQVKGLVESLDLPDDSFDEVARLLKIYHEDLVILINLMDIL